MESVRSLTAGIFDQFSSPHYTPQINEDVNDSCAKVVITDRKKTDFPFMITQLCGLLILGGIIIYALVDGDIERLTVGYDRCGNVCGKINKFQTNIQNCRAENMVDKPFYDESSHSCVESCGGQGVIGKRCINVNLHPSSFLIGVARDFQNAANEITGLSFIALGLSFVMLLILRYFTAVFVWGVLIGVIAGCVAIAVAFWALTERTEILIPFAAFFSICAFILLIVILVLRDRIRLVIQLLKEASKAVIDVPLLLFEPILTFVALAVAATAWIYFTLWIESCGTPQQSPFGTVIFQKNGFNHFSRWYNVFIMLWMTQFIYGCQNMIIAGTVSRWYFTRDKFMLKNTICQSIYVTLKYHLGTISFGSLIIALIKMLRILLRIIGRTLRRLSYLCCLCCVYAYLEQGLNYLESFVKYWTRNSYIITAIHGTEFLESGSRAFKLIVENVLKVIVINSVGDFVLVVGKLLIVIGTVLIGVLLTKDNEHLQYPWAVLLLVTVVAYLIAHCFITVYEMAVDTIFICFCEDSAMNDGITNPYYMSHNLMEFIERSKTVLKIKMDEAVTSA